MSWIFFFFQAEDGIRDRSPSRGLGDVYKRQVAAEQSLITVEGDKASMEVPAPFAGVVKEIKVNAVSYTHLRAHETDSYLVCRLLLEKKK